MNFRVLQYNQLDSTNNLAIDFACKNAAEGTVITADYQTHGRGRFTRKWKSKRGKDLLFSVILRPRVKPSAAPILTHIAAKSAAAVLQREFALKAVLKKPNDILVGGRKICGILTESKTLQQNVEYVVMGIGLNINSRKQDLPARATSIYLETGKEHDRKAVLALILNEIDKRYKEMK